MTVLRDTHSRLTKVVGKMGAMVELSFSELLVRDSTGDRNKQAHGHAEAV